MSHGHYASLEQQIRDLESTLLLLGARDARVERKVDTLLEQYGIDPRTLNEDRPPHPPERSDHKMLRLFYAATLAVAAALPLCAQGEFGPRAFHGVSVGESYELLPFSCDPKGPSCEGDVAGTWVRATIVDRHVYYSQSIYDGMKSDGSWFKVDHPSFVQALRENTYAKNHKAFQIGALFGEQGQVLAWVDMSNGILYEVHPNDRQQGISKVIYLGPDTKLVMLAVQNDLTNGMARSAFIELEKGMANANTR